MSRRYALPLVLSLVCAVVVLASVDVPPVSAAPVAGQVYPAAITRYPVPTKLSWPAGITAGPDGSTWFTEYRGNKIGRVGAGGTTTEFNLPPDTQPIRIAAGSDGNLWFTERSNDRVGRITPAGVVTEYPYIYIGGDDDGMIGGPDGSVWFTDGHSLARIAPSGVVTKVPNTNATSAQIAVAPDGKVWFASSDPATLNAQISCVTGAGVVTSFPVSDAYKHGGVGGVTIGSDGDIWYTEQTSFTTAIARMTPSGAITEFPVPQITYPDRTVWGVTPSDMVAGPDGNIYFISNRSAIGRITTGGQITEFLPDGTSSFGGGISPTGIAVGPDGNIWFADNGGYNGTGFLAVGGGAPPPLPLPSASASIPAPTPKTAPPTLTEFLQAANAAYGLDSDALEPPGGMTEVARSDPKLRVHGFEAVAFKDINNSIIIANEGLSIGPILSSATPYERATQIVEAAIGANTVPAALRDAAAFAEQIQHTYGATSSIYVTGHDLGGVEAEKQAQDPAAAITNGATFGATGLPKNTATGSPNLVNYVDYGDPLGNYASDPESALRSSVPTDINHYGSVKLIGDPSNAGDINSVLLTKRLLAVLGGVFKGLGELSGLTKATGGDTGTPSLLFSVVQGAYSKALYASIAVYLAHATYNYHSLAHYADDLQVSLKQTVAPAISEQEFLKLYR